MKFATTRPRALAGGRQEADDDAAPDTGGARSWSHYRSSRR